MTIEQLRDMVIQQEAKSVERVGNRKFILTLQSKVNRRRTRINVTLQQLHELCESYKGDSIREQQELNNIFGAAYLSESERRFSFCVLI